MDATAFTTTSMSTTTSTNYLYPAVPGLPSGKPWHLNLSVLRFQTRDLRTLTQTSAFSHRTLRLRHHAPHTSSHFSLFTLYTSHSDISLQTEDFSLRAFQPTARTAYLPNHSLADQPLHSPHLTPHTSHFTPHVSHFFFPHLRPPACQTTSSLVTSQSLDISPTPQSSHLWSFCFHVHCEHNPSTHQNLDYNYKHMQNV